MKHKKFTEIYPYTYYFKNNITGQKYHGVRWANVRNSTSPDHDFALKYFSSGKLRTDFKYNILDYTYRICWTFDTVGEARDYECKVNTKLLYRNDWEVWNNSKSIYNKISPSLGREVRGTVIAERISASNAGKIRSEESKNRMSDIQRQRVLTGEHNWTTEKHSIDTSVRMTENNPSKDGLSDEHKRKLSDAQKGIPKKPFSDKHKENLSISLKGHTPWNKGKIGVQNVSEETRKKMSESRKGKKHSKETKEKMKLNAGGTGHLIGKKISCICCKREWDLGNYTKHIKKVIHEQL